LLFENDTPEGFYAVNINTGKLLKGSLVAGYPKIRLYRTNELRIIKYHEATIAAWRLSTFIGLPPSKQHTADHIDRCPLNNSLSNLRWATKSDQVSNRSKFVNVGHTIPIIANNGDDIRKYTSVKDAAEQLQLHAPSISAVLVGRWQSVGGWTFKYDYIIEIHGEEWKQISKWLYVSDHGRVKREVHGGFIEVTHGTNSTYITLNRNGKSVGLHTVVAELFGDLIERRILDPTVEVDHINGDARNNHIRNLQILSIKDHVVKTHGRLVEIRDRTTGEAKTFPSIVATSKYLSVSDRNTMRYIEGEYTHHTYDVRFVDPSSKRRKLNNDAL
jgi:hypothetical protein